MTVPVTAPDAAPAVHTIPAPRASRRETAEQRRADRTAALFASLETPGTDRDQVLGEVVELNLPVADRVAARFARRGVPVEDLQQVAYLALVRAARAFDGDRADADFLSYAIPCMRGEVRKYFRDLGWMVRPTRRIQETQARVNGVTERLTAELGRSPRPAEIAERIEAPIEDVVEALSADGCFTPTSLDVPVGLEGSTGPLGDLIPGENLDLDAAEARATLLPNLQRLGERDRLIVALRFYEGLTQREIGERIGLTQVQVSRLLNRILGDLRTAMSVDAVAPAA